MLALMKSMNPPKDRRGASPQPKARGVLREDGASIVEMALSCSVILGMFFGIVYICFALYVFHYISDAAREGSRYAMVRGSTSCANSGGNLSNCIATEAQIQTYVQDLGYPGIDAANKMTVTTTWYTASSSGTPPTTTWSLCAGGSPAATTCKAPGNIVKVVVAYAYPLNIPFSGRRTLNMTSTSQMVVAQ
jgi:Flp pilus assembly protein TadG